MSKKKKFCVFCVFCVSPIESSMQHQSTHCCKHGKALDIVTGEPTPCREQRMVNSSCGYAALNFEPKKESSNSICKQNPENLIVKCPHCDTRKYLHREIIKKEHIKKIIIGGEMCSVMCDRCEKQILFSLEMKPHLH